MREICVRYYGEFYAKIVFRKGDLNIELIYPNGISQTIPRNSLRLNLEYVHSLRLNLEYVPKAEYDVYIIMRS